jgi:hypothetical protein
MDGKNSADPHFHYFEALGQLSTGNYVQARQAASKAGADSRFTIEASYITGWANLHCQDPEGAVAALTPVAECQDSPSCQHARAIVGAVRFYQGASADAVKWWQKLDQQRRAEWGFDEPLQKSIVLSGLQALGSGQFEQAAESFRDAGEAGLKDGALRHWMQFALCMAGKRLLYQSNGQAGVVVTGKIVPNVVKVGDTRKGAG